MFASHSTSIPRTALWSLFFVLSSLTFSSCACASTSGPGLLAGKESLRPFQLAQLRIPGFEPAPPSCEWLAKEPDHFETLESVSVSAADQPVTYVRLLSAGNTLAIRLPAAWTLKGSATIHVFSKTTGDWPFRPVCPGNTRPPRSGQHFLLARDPSRSEGSVWRVELRIKPTPGSHAAGRIEILRGTRSIDVDDKLFVASDPWVTASGLLCVDGVLAGMFPRLQSRGFSGRVKLDLDVVQDEFPLTDAQQAALTTVVLRAVSLWVVGCAACRAEHLAVVDVEGQTFVRNEIVKWYASEFTPQNTASGRTLARLEESLSEALESVQLLAAGDAPQPWPRAKQLSQYRASRSGAGDFTELCALDTSRAGTPTLTTIQRALCASASLDRNTVAKILIRFRHGSTACGDSANVIACRADRELTEYNSRDFRFSFGEPNLPPLGQGEVELDLLQAILHEMGHWIGLPHIDAGESIMASSLERSRCIDLPTIQALVDSQRNAQPEVFAGPSAFTLNTEQRARASKVD